MGAPQVLLAYGNQRIIYIDGEGNIIQGDGRSETPSRVIVKTTTTDDTPIIIASFLVPADSAGSLAIDLVGSDGTASCYHSYSYGPFSTFGDTYAVVGPSEGAVLKANTFGTEPGGITNIFYNRAEDHMMEIELTGDNGIKWSLRVDINITP